MKHTANLVVAPNDRVELSCTGILDEVLRILRQTLEVLVAALALHTATLTQRLHGFQGVGAVEPGIFQDARRSGVHFEQRDQQWFHADKLVAHLFRYVHSAHQHVVRLAAEVRLTALNARQVLHLGVDEGLYVNAVHPQFLEDECRDVFAFFEHALEQVHRFDDLLIVSSRLLHS